MPLSCTYFTIASYNSIMGRRLSDKHEILHAQQGGQDYRAHDAQSEIAITELKGMRDGQEDRSDVAVDKHVSLTPKEWKDALQTAVEKAQQDCGEAWDQGSTLICTVLVDNHIFTANVGDSTAYLMITEGNDESKKLVEFTRLNPELHQPHRYPENERLARVHDLNKPYDDKRLYAGGYGLALSRTIGDRIYESEGLIHDPSITHRELHLEKNQQALVLVACDGLTEYLREDSHDKDKTKSSYGHTLQDLLLIASTYSVPTACFQLATTAITRFASEDNVSVILTHLSPCSKVTKYMSIYDGHLGSDVAEALRKSFLPILRKEVADIQLWNEKQRESSDNRLENDSASEFSPYSAR